MFQSATYVPERLDHPGIEAFVCEEIGLAAYLDALDTSYHARVSVGTATVAMILNGLGLEHRRLYLVPQFFADKPVETLLGPDISANDLNDECLGRALDWLYAHDPTTLFAGIAAQARRVFGFSARQIHVNTTSFSVSGEYLPEEGDLDASVIAITYGYSRDHRADREAVDARASGRHRRATSPCSSAPSLAIAATSARSCRLSRHSPSNCGPLRVKRSESTSLTAAATVAALWGR